MIGMGAMGDGVVIRRAVMADKAALVALLEASWLANWGPHVSAASRARFAAERPALGEVESGWAQMEVALRDGVLVGMLLREGDYLEAIHVNGEHWGQGIGGALMGHAEDNGVRRLEVRAFNQRALAFYRRRGWVETGRRASTEMGTPVDTVEMRLG